MRKNGELEQVSWDEALDLVSERLRASSAGLLTLAGGRLSNEDLFNLRKFTLSLGGSTALFTHMSGGDLTSKFGFFPGTNLGELGNGANPDRPDAILVVGCDLEQEAPIYWLRVKQAADRGAAVIVLNSRETKLERAAKYSVHYPFGSAAAAVLAMANALLQNTIDLPESVRDLAARKDLRAAARVFAQAENAVVMFGSDGMGLAETELLAKACANLLLETNHVGRPNNGLLGVWPRANDQGAWELGWMPSNDLMDSMSQAETLYIIAADPVSDDPAFQAAFGGDKFVIVQDLTLSQTARLADVVFPAQSWMEREGSYISSERRVQRYYPAVQATTALPQKVEAPGTRDAAVLTQPSPFLVGPQMDFLIPALIAERLGLDGIGSRSAVAVFNQIEKENPAFAGIHYQQLSEGDEQWPIIGRSDLYYGGTSYENKQGQGTHLQGGKVSQPLITWPKVLEFKLPVLGLMAFPITRLFDRGSTLTPSGLLRQRIGEPFILLNVEDAGRLKVADGAMVRVTFSNSNQMAIIQARLDKSLPERVALIPRSFGLPISAPALIEIKPGS